MLLSKLFGKRTKEVPSEASLISHIFLLRGGYIKSVGSGIYSLLTPAVIIKRKIERIIREEMEKIGGQEIFMPVVLPGNLLERSGRISAIGDELLKFKDRNSRSMLLAMTHEEPVVDLSENFAKSYSDYPFMVYQIQTKFRDEPRARGGLVRLREFTMKDAYSFHTSQEDLMEFYEKVLVSYRQIYRRIGLPEVVSIQSDSGMMGGDVSHEFMLLCDSGEDSIILCERCGYKANSEVAESILPDALKIRELPQNFKVKVHFYKSSEAEVVVYMRSDLCVNEAKLKKLLCKDLVKVKDKVFSNMDEISEFISCGEKKNEKEIFYDISLKDFFKVDNYYELYKVEEGHLCKKCGAKLTVKRGIEVGNIFQLGTRYTKSMNVKYKNKDNSESFALMGCYGIGVTRLIASLIEAHHDRFGPIWPKTVCPWQVHICALNFDDELVCKRTFALYNNLSKNFEVLLDDRNLSVGAQFAEADLLGVPVRVTVSKKNVNTDFVELRFRGEGENLNVKISELGDLLNELYA